MNLDLNTLSYPDFVALMGQENTPPGGVQTVDSWRRSAQQWWAAGASSGNLRVLDLACSTGFSGRQFASGLDRPVNVTGIDLSEQAVMAATAKAPPNDHFIYVCSDASRLPFDDASFDIVLVGCNFAFIDQREAALGEAHRVLTDGGMLCAANFFYRRSPPDELLQAVGEVVGFHPSPHWDFQFWRQFFSRTFDLHSSHTTVLKPVSRASLLAYAAAIGVFSDAPNLIAAQRVVAARRMYRDRSILNRHRHYQGVVVDTWTKPR